MTRRRWGLIAALILIIVTSAAYQFTRPTTSNNKVTPPPQSSTAKPQPKDPLTIEAMRARSYPASQIKTEQDYGVQGGHHDYKVAYESDGNTIYSRLSVPLTAKPSAGWPVIILAHGYVNPAQYVSANTSYADFVAAFTRAGYMVIKPDYRGHGDSEGEPLGGHFAPVYAYDLMNLIASLKQYDQVDTRRIGQFGHSMGGHEVLRTMVISKDIKATVIMAGVVGSMEDFFYNWPHSPAPNDQPTELTRGIRKQLVEKYGDPKANPSFWHNVSAINYVDQTSGAVQVNHDEQDSIVPKLFSDHLADALKKANKPVDYYVYPGDDHQFAANRALLLQRAVSFYQKNL